MDTESLYCPNCQELIDLDRESCPYCGEYDLMMIYDYDINMEVFA